MILTPIRNEKRHSEPPIRQVAKKSQNILCGLVSGLLMLTAGIQDVDAARVIGSGLSSPTRTITFSEVRVPSGAVVTTQFARWGAGVTFGSRSSTEGLYLTTAGHPGQGLQNYFPDTYNPFVLKFDQPVTAAAFEMTTNGHTDSFTALLKGVVVDTFSVKTGGWDFYGFTGIVFDEIQVHIGQGQHTNDHMRLDNLQIGAAAPVNSAPAPVVDQRVVNIDFQPGGNTYSGVGALGGASDTRWNAVGPAGGSNLTYADGSPSTVAITPSGYNAGYANNQQINPLLNDWIYSTSTTEPTLRISGLAPNSLYDIAFYNGFYWQDYTVQGQQAGVAQTKPVAAQGSAGAPPFPQGTYGILQGVRSTASGTISITTAAKPGGNYGVDETIAGMQIQKQSTAGQIAAPPTPSAPTASLVPDGGFEVPLTSTLVGKPVGSKIGGWTVIGPANSTFLVSLPAWNKIPAREGKVAVHIGGYLRAGGVSRSFATRVGTTYQISLWAVNSPNRGTGTGKVRVHGGGELLNQQFQAPAPPSWKQSSFSFTARASTTTIEIQNVSGGLTIDDVTVTPAPTMSLTHPRNPIATDVGSWTNGRIRMDALPFASQGANTATGWNIYKDCYGKENWHPQHVVRLANKNGLAYFMVAQSDKGGGFITLLQTHPNQLDSSTDLIKTPPSGGNTGAYIWADGYPSNGANPIGSWNHPGKMEVIGGLLVVAAQNWSTTCPTGSGLGSSIDALLFYDVRDPENPKYLGKINEDELGVNEISTVGIVKTPNNTYILTAGGDGRYSTWRAQEITTDIKKWTRIPTPIAESFSGQHGMNFNSYQRTTRIGNLSPRAGEERVMFFDADGKYDNFMIQEYVYDAATGFLKLTGTKQFPIGAHNLGNGLIGADRDWDADSLYVTRYGKPVIYTIESAGGVHGRVFQLHNK